MDKKLSYHVQLFSDKVRVLNQTNRKTITMDADEARSLQSDIFALLCKIAELTDGCSKEPNVSAETVEIKLDGGKFKT